MALTTYTNRTLANGFTQQQLYDEVKAAMVAAGFSAPVDENGASGSTMEMIFQKTFNAATKGNIFLRIQVPSGASPQLNQTIYDTYNTSTNTGTNGSPGALTLTIPNTTDLKTLTINNPEMQGICLTTGTTERGFIGLVRPETKPTWWNENTWPYAFILGTAVQQLNSCAAAIQPAAMNFTNAYYGPQKGSAGFATVNPTSGVTDLLEFGYLTILGAYQAPSYGGKFSDDLFICQGSGRIQSDTFTQGAIQAIYLGQNIAHRIAE